MSVEIKEIKISQLIPERKTLSFEGLYLNHNLLKIAEQIRRPFVYTNYVSDLDDVISVKDKNGDFKVPDELKNPSDWQLFLELEAQADVIITGGGYLKRFASQGEAAENILSEFEPGGKFENLGEWRLHHGYKSRSPDIAIASRSLDFDITEEVTLGRRKVTVFTIDKMVDSEKGKKLRNAGLTLVESGEEGVDGKIMIDHLGSLDYRTVEMTTGPRILKILLDGRVLDRIYISRVQRRIKFDDPSSIGRILLTGERLKSLKNFSLTQKYEQVRVVVSDGQQTSQQFLVYDSKKFLEDLKNSK